ncbi:hypothetical protein ILUMI_16591 [Ignelater luminosus]|uniref:Integrase catalytic domain-containing protein n=1 Tax=Ignelater luminosus TaxID=2038154 RepID=A0A8K0CQ03_IGNLU|nr:hypothetical protein ILUMI_16591 [Ignelater luminosus]
MHHLSFDTRVGCPTKPGELTNIDVCGPRPEPSVSGKRYFVDFKDNFSKYRSVYFLKEKSEVKEKLEQFLAEVNVAGHIVKELLTDGSKDFNNVAVQNITRKAGLQHRLSMPYTRQQNGAGKQDNRTLVETETTMLHAKNLQEKLWDEAVNTATYISNRTEPTPQQASHLMKFGMGKQHTLII